LKHKVSHIVTLACVALISGCAGPNRELPAAPAMQDPQGTSQTLAGVVHGNFTEYAVPRSPGDLAKGPYNTLWWVTTVPFGVYPNGYTLYRFAEGTGVVTGFSRPAPWGAQTNPLTLTGGRIYYITFNTDSTGPPPEYLSSADWTGAISTGPRFTSDSIITSIALGSDGRIWFPECIESCSMFGGAVASISLSGNPGPGAELPDFFIALRLTSGPGGFIYATASTKPAFPSPVPEVDSAAFVISTAGKVVQMVTLPHGSDPADIAVGPDKNLWIAEPGINKIARMTPTGSVTQFSIPTANAGTSWLTPGADTAVWFTETNANKIGRITPAGSITEYTIPTPDSLPGGIDYCTTNCPPHGGVWFSEKAKIGKFTSPL
jgi:hypothetical protein